MWSPHYPHLPLGGTVLLKGCYLNVQYHPCTVPKIVCADHSLPTALSLTMAAGEFEVGDPRQPGIRSGGDPTFHPPTPIPPGRVDERLR